MKTASEARPNTGRVIIKPVVQEHTSLVINPGEEKEKPQHGKVISIGKRKNPNDKFVMVGDMVAYGKYSGITIEFADGPHMIINESEILSTI